jgi:hypothetical protein
MELRLGKSSTHFRNGIPARDVLADFSKATKVPVRMRLTPENLEIEDILEKDMGVGDITHSG